MSQPVPPYVVYVQPQPSAPTNGIAIAGLVLGIIGASIALIPIIGVFFAWLPAVLAIIFGSIGLYNASRLGGLRRATSWWALALGLSPIPIWFAGAAILTLLGVAVPGANA